MGHTLPYQDIHQSLLKIWSNIYWLRNYLVQYEVIADYADQLNQDTGHFWGITQKSALDSVVLNICKLFDETSPHYEKDTIPSVIKYANKNLTTKLMIHLDLPLLRELQVSSRFFETYSHALKDLSYYNNEPEEFVKFTTGLLHSIKESYLLGKSASLSEKGLGHHLERLFKYRNKVLAHQEILDAFLKEQLKSLPPLEEMNKIAIWAQNFCIFINRLFFPYEELPHFYPYAAGETRTVIRQFLGNSK